MSPVTLFLAQLIGATLMVFAAMLLVRRDEIAPLARRMLADPGVVMMSGAMRTVMGLAIVLGHDDWSSGLATAVTLFGWLLLASGALLLFSSEERLLRLFEAMKLDRRLTVYAAGMAVAGLLFFGEGFLARMA